MTKIFTRANTLELKFEICASYIGGISPHELESGICYLGSGSVPDYRNILLRDFVETQETFRINYVQNITNIKSDRQVTVRVSSQYVGKLSIARTLQPTQLKKRSSKSWASNFSN